MRSYTTRGLSHQIANGCCSSAHALTASGQTPDINLIADDFHVLD